MLNLTLDEVREAGRFAFNEVRGPGEYRADWTRRENGEFEVEVIADSGLTDMLPVPVDGWRHEDGCDCEYCK